MGVSLRSSSNDEGSSRVWMALLEQHNPSSPVFHNLRRFIDAVSPTAPTLIQCLPSPTLPWYRWRSPLVPTPLAAVGIDRVIAAFWGICTELHSREFPGIQLPPRGPLLLQPPWCNTRPPGPLLSQRLVWFQASRTSSAAFWGIGIQRHPIGNSLELCRNPPGIPLDTLPVITPGFEDHLPDVLLGIPGTLLTLRWIDVALVW